MEVDLVFTWVDDDAAHRQAKGTLGEIKRTSRERKSRYGLGRRTDAAVPGRFRCNREITQAVQSALVFAPWLRNIFIVCADYQSPDFLLPLSPKVKIVHHSEIYGAMSNHLPVFNSHSIEAHLHQVPGLAEHFLYANDDNFFGAPVSKSAFFDSAGRPKLVGSGGRLKSSRPNSSQSYIYSRYNTFTLMKRVSKGLRMLPRIIHQTKPLTKSLYAAIWSHPAMRGALASTSRAKFRSQRDIWPVGLALYYGLKNGTVTRGRLRSGYYPIRSTDNLKDKFARIRRAKPPLYCLNDVMSSPSAAFIKTYRRLLKSSLPHHGKGARVRTQARSATRPPSRARNRVSRLRRRVAGATRVTRASRTPGAQVNSPTPLQRSLSVGATPVRRPPRRVVGNVRAHIRRQKTRRLRATRRRNQRPQRQRPQRQQPQQGQPQQPQQGQQAVQTPSIPLVMAPTVSRKRKTGRRRPLRPRRRPKVRSFRRNLRSRRRVLVRLRLRKRRR